MKKIKYVIIIIVMLFVSAILQIHILGQMFPLKKHDVDVSEITIAEYEEWANYHPYLNKSVMRKINNNPDRYIAIFYAFHIENMSEKELILEHLSIKIPEYKIISQRIDTEAESQDYFTAKDTNHQYGSMIVYIGDNDRQTAIEQIKNTMKIKAVYFIYDLFSFAVDVI